QNMGENPKQGFLTALSSKDLNVRISTAALMIQVNHEPESALPVLLAALKEKDAGVRVQAAAALAPRRQQTDKIVPILVEGLKNEKSGVRPHALQALQQLGPAGSVAAPALIELLQDPEQNIRQMAIYALQSVRGDPKVVVPALAKLMKSSDNDNIRQGIIQVLSLAGAEGLPPLMDALQDKNESVRWTAAASIRNMGQAGRKAAPILLELVQKDSSANVRMHAVYTLINQGGESVKELLGVAKEVKGSDMRLTLVQGLSNFGVRVKEAIPFLTESLKYDNPQLLWPS